MLKSALGWRYVILPLEITEGGFAGQRFVFQV